MDAIYPYRDPDPEIDLLTTLDMEEWDEGDDKLEEDWMEEEEEEGDDWWIELLDCDEAW